MNNNVSQADNIGIVILAAGSSSRLGTPKQLLIYENQTLLARAIATAVQTGAFPVVVVLGSDAAMLKNEIQGHGVISAINENWREGMASSIKCGINELYKSNPYCEGVILMMSDQPHVTSYLLKELVQVHKTECKNIVTSMYEGISGPPVFFHKTLIPQLMELSGDSGARKVVESNKTECASVSFPAGIIDIDTRDDYVQLLSQKS